MSYRSYDYFTRKQCNLLYKAFKRGQLVPPKDCRGKIKHPGFVYRYEGCSRYCGFYLSEEENLFNCQLAALREVIRLVCENKIDAAQAILNCEDSNFLWNYLPQGFNPKKMWKVI